MAKNWSAKSKATLTDNIIFGIAYSITFLISLLPLKVLYMLSDGLYVLIYRVVGYRRKIVRKNLTTSFPDKSMEEIDAVERGFYHYFCDYIFETVKLATMSHEEMKRRIKIEGIEIIYEMIEKNKSVTLYLGHYCNWEWVTSIGLYMPEKCFGSQIYHVLESKPMDMLMLKLRSRMCTVNIPMQETMRQLIRKKQEGKVPVTGFISDQSPVVFDVPHWITFLHHDTPFINGTERLTKKLNSAAVYLDISRPRRGYYYMEMQLMAEDTKDIPDWQITDDYARRLEATIRRQPEFWLWSHNRWKRGRKDYFNDKTNKG